MAKTLLNGVNEVLKRTKQIQGDSGTLSTLTDSARQLYIDLAVQCWNEVIEDLYSILEEPLPSQLKAGTITLVTNTRAYALASDVIQMHWPLINTTTGQVINEYRPGYLVLLNEQLTPSTFTGLPQSGVIRPTDGYIYLDRIPTSVENGLVYTYQYNKDFSLSAAADTFPFSNAVFRALVPAVKERWNLDQKQVYNEPIYEKAMATAARLMNVSVDSDKQYKGYLGISRVTSDPFEG